MDETYRDSDEQVTGYYRPKNKKEREARRTIWERYRAMADDELRQQAEQDWELGDKIFRQWMPERTDGDWRSHITLPDGFSAVQAYLQESINRRSRPILEVTNGSDLPRELFVNSILTYNMDATGYDMEQFKARQCAAIRGDGYVMERYRLEKRDVHDPTSVNEDGTLEYTKREIIDTDDTFTEFIENEFIFVDPSARDQNSARDMVEREILNWDDFQRIYKKKGDFMNIELVPKAGAMPENVGFFQMPKDMTDSDVEILHYYNRNTDTYDVLANNVLIRLGYIPFKHKELPFAKYAYYSIPGNFHSMGIPKVILSLTEERKSLRNLAIDRQHMQVDKMFLVNDIVDLDDEDVRTRPNGFIQVNTNGLRINEVITPLEYGDIPASYYQQDNALLDDIRRAHGINEQMQAQSTGGTATEAAQLQQAAQARINMINQLSEMETVIRIGRLKWSNIQFFYPAPKVETIVTDDDEKETKTYKTIKVKGMSFEIAKNPEGGNVLKTNDITGSSGFTLDKTHAKFMQGDFDINVNAETSQLTSKPIRQAKITEMFNLLAINPQLLGTIDPNKAVERYLEINDEDPKDWMRNTGKTTADWKRLAIHENLVMAQGQVLAPTEGATTDHTEEHLNFTATAMFQALPEATKLIFQEHILGEHESNPTTGNVADAMPGGGAPAEDDAIEGNTPTQGQTTEIAPVDLQPSTVGGEDRRDAQQGAVTV